MDSKAITTLTDGLGEYSSDPEIKDLCAAFEVDPEIDPVSERPVYHRLAIKLITKVEHGNNRELLNAIVNSLVTRANDKFAHSDWERRTYHQSKRVKRVGKTDEVRFEFSRQRPRQKGSQ